ncbi:hypothetical protein [Mycoplasma sp. SG1]|uniref:Ppx/GppA phosphatase family protein n=1 Tax=Mycoplasma sp. SG1 TaxID=2810348 RepID=UPI002024B93F|nr:hypothetical protein [Mycoplasma sp. SG1]URM52797.1 hypothetical protein JRW51_00420 [Mycoplasma sp. SG1]
MQKLNFINYFSGFIVIDIGSNSIKSTFYQINFQNHTLIKHPFYRRLFKLLNHFKNGLLSQYVIDKIVDDFRDILLRISKNEIFANTKIYCFGTEVLRRAINYTYIQMLIYRQTGIYIDILVGGREGYISYLAFINFYLPNNPKTRQNYCLLDYGGGSCEVTICQQHKISEIKSLKIGSLVLLLKHKHNYKIDWNSIKSEIDRNLTRISTKENIFYGMNFFSSSASLKSINFLMTKVFYKMLVQKNPNIPIIKDNIMSMICLFNLIMPMNDKELQSYHILKIGYNSIRCALLTFISFYNKFKIKEIKSITFSIRDGYLAMILSHLPEVKDILVKNKFIKWKIKNIQPLKHTKDQVFTNVGKTPNIK